MKAQEVAKYIVNLCVEKGSPVSNLNLQKIMYFAHCYSLRFDRGELITDDYFEAWQFGPVIPSVYHAYSHYASAPIIPFDNLTSEIPKEKMEFFDDFIEDLSKIAPWDLVRISHLENGAWFKTYKNGIGQGAIIPANLIREEAKAGL